MATAMLVLSGLSVAGCDGDTVECPVEVDRAEWQRAPITGRYPLAKTLSECGTLEDKSKEEVRRALGQPDSPRGETLRGATEWEYYLGDSEGGLGPGDARNLYVRFGVSGRVTETEVDPE